MLVITTPDIGAVLIAQKKSWEDMDCPGLGDVSPTVFLLIGGSVGIGVIGLSGLFFFTHRIMMWSFVNNDLNGAFTNSNRLSTDPNRPAKSSDPAFTMLPFVCLIFCTVFCIMFGASLFLFSWSICGFIIYDGFSAECKHSQLGRMVLAWSIIKLLSGAIVSCFASLRKRLYHILVS